MNDIDPETERVLNDAFAERLKRQGGSSIDVLIETEPGRASEVREQLGGIEGVSTQPAISGRFIPATVPEEQLGRIARVDGVRRIHQDQRVGVNQDFVFPQMPRFLTPAQDPVRRSVSNAIERFATTEDPFLGNVAISKVEVPAINLAQVPPGNPVQTLASAVDFATGANATRQKFIPTSTSTAFMHDTDALADATGSGVKAAVIDTGHTPTPGQNRARTPHLESFVPGEPPIDMMGHGSWCTNTVVGAGAPSSWGRVTGFASEAEYGHFKALNTFPGFGKTSWILRAMEAANDWGADVISMSLGGAQQGPIDQDPFVTTIDELSKETAGDEAGSIFVVAAGNSGPDKWTIGSPGVAPKALTVASWSLTDAAPAVWSSRGPQGDWYMSNDAEFESDLNRVGLTFIKPDVAAPGGGRETEAKADERDEYLHQSETGWIEGFFDGLKDARGLMHGTSMACPHVAGFVALAYEAGLVGTARDVKRAVRENAVIPAFAEAAPTAREATGGKNLAVGHGVLSTRALTG